MTTERILNALYATMNEFKEEATPADLIGIARKCNGDLSSFHGACFRVAELIYKLETEEKNKAIKKAGKAELLKAVKAICKSAYKEQLQKPYMSAGYQIACDGFRLIAIPEQMKLDVDTCNYEQLSVKPYLSKPEGKNALLPDLNELKTEVKRIKAIYKKSTVLVLLDSEIAFNADYLICNCSAINTDHLTYKDFKSCAYFNDNTTGVFGILMPVNTKNVKDGTIIINVNNGRVIPSDLEAIA